MPTASPSRPSPRSASSTARARLAIASRTVAALVGGYAVTSLLATVLALLARATPREEAILAATTPAFLAFAACIVWAFVASTVTRAWLGIAIPAVALALLVWRFLPAS